MKSEMKLRVKTKPKVKKSVGLEEKNEELEPASPTSNYFLCEDLTLYILAIFELEILVNTPSIYAFLKDIFLDSHPRFSSIPVEDEKGRKWWKRVEANVEDHVKVPIFEEGLSPETYSEHLDDHMSKIATSQLSLHKPLWELHIFNYPTNKASATIIVKFHHAIADGTSLMGVVFSCFKRVDDPMLPITFPSYTNPCTTINTASSEEPTVLKIFKIVPKFVSSIFYSIYDFAQELRVILFEDDRTPIRSGNTNMILPYSTRICSVTLSLNDVRRIKSLLGVTVNDVLVGIITFATQLYIQETDQGRLKNTSCMTASIAINIRSVKGYATPEEMRQGNSWGNKVTNIKLPLPKLEEDDFRNPLKFIMKAHEIISRKRRNVGSLYLMACFLDAVRIVGGVKAAARTFENSWKNSTFAITNLIGPAQHISIANHPIKGFYFVPTGVNLSLTISVMSYMQMLTIGLAVEKDFIDHQRLIVCVEKAFQLIFQAATTTPKSATE